jgi:opacity protein-like surface antigen
MKFKVLASTALLAVLSVSAYAGPEAKDMKMMAPEIRPSDAGFYVGIYGGANFAQNYNTHTAFTPDNTTFPGFGNFKQGGSTSGGVGGVGGIKGGYNFESYPIAGDFGIQPAVEVEALYLGALVKTKFNYTGTPAGTINASGSSNAGAFMVNGILRFKTGSIVTPYIGSGIGLQYTTISGTLTSGTNVDNGGANHYHQDALAFAVQGLLGADVEIAKHWDLFTEYKYLVAIDPQYSSVNFDGFGDTYTFHPDYQGQHLITAGIKYNF